MTRPGMPYDPESDATRRERPPLNPPGSDATEVEHSPSYQPGSDATQLERPPSNTPGSDATQLERPRSNPPGSDATQVGYPPSYPVSPPTLPGYPPGTPVYAAPPPAERPGSLPGPPPSYPPGGYPPPPPVRPPSSGRGGLIFVVGGVLLVLLAVVAGIVLVMMHNGGDTDNARSTQPPQTVTVAASATVTTAANVPPATISVRPTIATITTVTATPSIAPTLSGPTDSWTDPENRVMVRFPADWQKDTFDTHDENSTLEKSQPLLQLTGPDRVRFSVTIYLSAQTLDEDVRAFRDAGTNDPKIAFRPDPTQDVTVGGEPAKRLTGSYTQNGETILVAVWFVDHGGKRFALSADRIGTHRDTIDAIVVSTSFVPAGARVVATAAPTAAVPATRAPTALATTSSIFGTPATPGIPTATRSP